MSKALKDERKFEKKRPRNHKKDEPQVKLLRTYPAHEGREFRLHDVEFYGKSYFDFRLFEKYLTGVVSRKRGIRLSAPLVEFLEDAIWNWKSYHAVRDCQKSLQKEVPRPHLKEVTL